MGRQKDAGKTIGEVEKLTGIPKRTLKYYIERGLLTPQRKSSSGYWLYSEEDIRRLRLIFLCRELEYSDSGIRTLLAAPEVRWQEELDRQIDLLLEQRGQTEEKLVAAELMRCCWRTRGTLERDAGALSPALGELFEKDRPPRLRAGAREELCRTIYGALSEALGTDRPPECLKKLLREDPAGGEVQAWAAALCQVFRARAGLSPEEVLFAFRLSGALGGMDLLLDEMLGQEGAARSLTETVQLYCDRANPN